MRELTITHSDREWQPAFCAFVHRQFPSLSFERWTAYGGWDDGYLAFALADGDRLVASASLARMDLVLDGEPVRGWQLGAVATDPAYQRQQLQRHIMRRLMAHPKPGDFVFLFANETVLEFYPKFGFHRVRESLFGAPYRAEPEGGLRKLSVESAEDRALLLQLAARAEPATRLFGARNYGTTLLWYFCNFHREHFHYSPELDAVVVAEQIEDTLHVYDVVARQPVDLARLIPRIVRAPIARLVFGYTPTRDWPRAVPLGEYTDSPLFVLGSQRLPSAPFKYPILAQT